MSAEDVIRQLQTELEATRVAMQTLQAQMLNQDRALTARLAYNEAEILRIRDKNDKKEKGGHKSGIMDSRKIYPEKLKDMSRWKKWSARALRWAKMESPELHDSLVAAGKSRKVPIHHDCGDEAVFFWAHLEGWILDPEAAKIVRHVKEDDGVEAWRQLVAQFDPLTALTKGRKLKAIQAYPETHRAKKNRDVPGVMASFEEMISQYYEDFKTEALSDDLKKQAYMDLIPETLAIVIRDYIAMREMDEDEMNSSQIKAFVMSRIQPDIHKDTIPMDVDLVLEEDAEAAGGDRFSRWKAGDDQADWANSLGTYPQQGAVGKGGKAKGKDSKGKDGKSGGKDGKGDRPIGACSHCWGFGHYYRACPVRLGPEEAAKAEAEFARKGGGKGAKGKGKKGKGKSKGKGKVYSVEEGEEYWPEGEDWPAEEAVDAESYAVFDYDEEMAEFCACIEYSDESICGIDDIPEGEPKYFHRDFANDCEDDEDGDNDGESADEVAEFERPNVAYRGLRDIDPWVEQDPWRRLGTTSTGSTSTWTHTSRTTSAKALVSTESGKAPPSTDEPGSRRNSVQIPGSYDYDAERDVHTFVSMRDEEYERVRPAGQPIFMKIPNDRGFSKVRIGSHPVKEEEQKPSWELSEEEIQLLEKRAIDAGGTITSPFSPLSTLNCSPFSPEYTSRSSNSSPLISTCTPLFPERVISNIPMSSFSSILGSSDPSFSEHGHQVDFHGKGNAELMGFSRTRTSRSTGFSLSDYNTSTNKCVSDLHVKDVFETIEDDNDVAVTFIQKVLRAPTTHTRLTTTTNDHSHTTVRPTSRRHDEDDRLLHDHDYHILTTTTTTTTHDQM